MTGLAWTVFWLLGLWSLGTLFLKWPFERLTHYARSDVLKNILAFSVGLIIYSYFWYGLGLLGWVGYPALIFWGCASAVLIVLTRIDLIKNIRTIFKNTKNFLKNDPDLQILFYLTASLMLVTALRCWSSYVDGDSLVYHLYLPKLWASIGRIGNFSFSEHALWPSFIEVCFIPAELIGSIVASKIVSFFLYVFLVISVGSYVFERTCHSYGAMIASACLASTPFFFRHAPSAYNDIAFGYFAVLSVIALAPGLKEPERRGNWGVGALAGILMGASLSCKYIGFYALFAVSGAWILDLFLTRKKNFSWRTVSGFFLGTLVTGAPFYLRAYEAYQNPVFPFAQRIFGTSFGYKVVPGLIAPTTAQILKGAGTSFFDFLALPINLVFRPELFGNEKVGIFFLLFLPFLFLSLRKSRFFFFFCTIYASIWFSLYQGTRYLTPVFPVLAIMIGIGWSAHVPSKHGLLPALRALVLSGLVVFNLWAIYYAYKDFTCGDNHALIKASAQINSKIAGKHAKVLVVGENRVYYYDFVAIRELGFRNFTSFPDFSPDHVERLLEQEGIGYILIANPTSIQVAGLLGDGRNFDPVAYFREFAKVNRMQKVLDLESTNAITYQLYRMISEPEGI